MSAGKKKRPSKHDAFLAFFAEGWVSVQLDGRRPEVIIPDHLRGEPCLVLQYGRDMPVPIPDLKVEEDGISATLSFARTPHSTFVPWSAVYIVACTDGRGIVYSEDVPQDIVPEPSAGRRGSAQTARAEATAYADRSPDAENSLDTLDGDGERPMPAPAKAKPRHLVSVPTADEPNEKPTTPNLGNGIADAATAFRAPTSAPAKPPFLRLVK